MLRNWWGRTRAARDAPATVSAMKKWALLGFTLVAACAQGTGVDGGVTSGGTDPPPDTNGAQLPPSGSSASGGSSGASSSGASGSSSSSSGSSSGSSGDAGADAAKPGPVYDVYASTIDTLFGFDPKTSTLKTIAKYPCLNPGEPMLDIAVSTTGAMYGVSYNRFFSIDRTTATCTSLVIAGGIYPNSLAFVPAGTVDAAKEALVGYRWNSAASNNTELYTRIDTVSGNVIDLGNLNPPGATTIYQVSGDLFSLGKDGKKTFVTVRPAPENPADMDLLAEVDPKTGTILRIVGPIGRAHLYGVGYWAGKGYGFAESGEVVSIDMLTGAATTVTTGAAGAWYGGAVSADAPLGP